MGRNLYLKTVTLEEAAEKYEKKLAEAAGITCRSVSEDVYKALGRVTAEPVFARCCSPLFNAAAMDGIAVKSAATRAASDVNPLTLKLGEEIL